MSLLTEKRYSPDDAAKKLGLSRSTFDRNVRPKLRVIQHSARFIEIPESSLEEYLQSQLTLGTPATPVEPASVPVPVETKAQRKRRPARRPKMRDAA